VRLLLDSHTMLWYFHDPTKLSTAAQAAIDSEENQPYISAASFWEMAIKAGLGKLRLSKPLSEIRKDFVSHGAQILNVTADHAIAVEHLAQHHRDPFDRLLAVQALAESLTLVSKDGVFDLYGVPRLW
jgi:PIN domain nuclease of toxin-antitoxin system